MKKFSILLGLIPYLVLGGICYGFYRVVKYLLFYFV